MSLRVLHLEDDLNDRELVHATLHAEEIDCTIVPVACRDEFERELADRPDLILADFSLPAFSGEQAQTIARATCPDVPFVFVSGSIGEEKAVECLREGATDYVLKGHLDKLPMAVRRALREAEDRRARAAAETALRQLNAELEARVEERTRALLTANAALEAARREADRANHAKSDFLSRMSHDLRTPLNAIIGFSELLQLDPLSPEQADSVAHVVRAGGQLLIMINEILDISRIEAGHLTLSAEPVMLAEIVVHAVALMQPLAAHRQIVMTYDVADDAWVFADRQRLNQVLLNLLSNAVKYNRPGGTVKVTARRAGDEVQIAVADTGAGIPSEKLSLLFVPFERLGAEQSGVEGTGLGLALAKRLTEAMHGTLTADSVIDEGTSFGLRLPASYPAASDVERPDAAVPDGHGVVGNVLYIEDNTANAQLMRRILARRPGVVFRHAASGSAGLDLLKSERPHLVLLDLHLADMSGEEVLRHIWDNPQTRAIPVVVLSADATETSRRRLLASGALRYIAKPLEVTAILRLLDDVLGPTKENETVTGRAVTLP